MIKIQLIKGLFWFRIFGFGLHIKNRMIHKDLYSTRNSKRLIIGDYAIKLLKPVKMDIQDIFNEWKKECYGTYGKYLPYDDLDLMLFACYYHRKIKNHELKKKTC